MLVVHACQLDAHGFHVIMESHLHFLVHAQSPIAAKAVQFSFLSHAKNGERKAKL